jgi:TPR repeat protein
MASEKGHPQAVYQLALRSKRASPEEVTKALKIAADGCLAESAYRYAFMVQNGERVPRNLREAAGSRISYREFTVGSDGNLPRDSAHF